MMQRLEPIAPEELGEYHGLLNRWKVYGIVRRRDLDESVLENMRRRRSGISQREIEYLRIRKSRRWALLPGFPQLGHVWEAVFDFGPYKSTYNGKHDLDGGRQCDLCHTWCRFGHLLTHPDWPHGPVIVGRTCAILLSDVDPDWVEKKLEREFALRLQKQQERLRLEAQRLQRQREEEESRLRKAMAAESEAQQIAAAMLRDYALRQQGHKVRLVPLIPGQQVLDAAADPAWQRSCRERQRVIASVLDGIVAKALYRTSTGNQTFQAEITGIPFSGTVYRYGDGWKAVVNRPNTNKPEHSDRIFPHPTPARDWMVTHLIRALCDYVTTWHAKQNYPWENASCRLTA
jgi:hypothetical protein